MKRRAQIVPALNYLYNFGRRLVVWVFDESSFYVSDFRDCGYADTSVSGYQFKPHIQAGGQKGKRINVSAFISREYGVLRNSVNECHVGALNSGTNDEVATANLFRLASRLLHLQYPDDLHIIVTDSPSIHSAMPTGACDPSKINMRDGGVNRGEDRLFGWNGFLRISKS